MKRGQSDSVKDPRGRGRGAGRGKWRKKESIKKIGKARKSFLESRVQRVRAWGANFRQKY